MHVCGCVCMYVCLSALLHSFMAVCAYQDIGNGEALSNGRELGPGIGNARFSCCCMKEWL